jgi:hypothetical protein
MLFNMATPPAVDVTIVASTAVGVAPAPLPVANSTLQTVAAASCECTVGALVPTGAPTGITAGATTVPHPHPLIGPPFLAAGASAPASRCDRTTSRRGSLPGST